MFSNFILEFLLIIHLLFEYIKDNPTNYEKWEYGNIKNTIQILNIRNNCPSKKKLYNYIISRTC